MGYFQWTWKNGKGNVAAIVFAIIFNIVFFYYLDDLLIWNPVGLVVFIGIIPMGALIGLIINTILLWIKNR